MNLDYQCTDVQILGEEVDLAKRTVLHLKKISELDEKQKKIIEYYEFEIYDFNTTEDEPLGKVILSPRLTEHFYKMLKTLLEY